MLDMGASLYSTSVKVWMTNFVARKFGKICFTNDESLDIDG